MRCDQCNRLIVRRISLDKKRWHFCDRDCLIAARKRGGAIAVSRIAKSYVRTCALPACGKTFTYVKRYKQKQYCDRKCAGLARRAGGLIAQKVETTTLEHHGVRRVFCDQGRMKSIMQARYGVNNASQIPGLRKESWKKAHETKKQNGTYKASKIERAFFDAVLAEGSEVYAQRVELGKPIDITIIEGDDTYYVQVDGRYWHGLDRQLDEIARSDKLRDRSILRRWHDDRLQDEQFAEHGLKLVRVTDHEAKEWLRQRRHLVSTIRERAHVMRSMISPSS